ncbi:MAG TPA: NAD(P)-dependent oxidoreductase [Thermomicrobiales bacterium]|nr:NAD(P)-dependent oxidoreductase [Thermomicrobiales bacterium]
MVVETASHSVISSVEELDDILTTPSEALVADLASLDGDVMVIGASGKMGPTLSMLAQRALDAAGAGHKAIAVARFSDAAMRTRLDAAGVTTIAADMHDAADLAGLPDAPNIVYMLGTKFGTTGREYQTWATNVGVAGKVAERFPESRFTVFSSGNIYPFRPVTIGGATEDVTPEPVGEYAQSCLARERMFEHASVTRGTPVAMFRLNYAIDLRYGVLYDIASQVHAGEAVDITMGNVNVIWQGDANAMALRMLTRASSPPAIYNVTGPETIPMRYLVEEFADRFGVAPKMSGQEAETALLNNAAKAFGVFGYPSVPLATMIDRVAAWIEAGGPTLDKPTHFQARDGRF